MLEIRRPVIQRGVSTRAAYDQYFEAHDMLLRDSFYLWLIDLLNPTPRDILLDISCGQGRLVELATRRGLNAVGVDFSFSGLSKGQRAAPAAKWAMGNGEGLPFADNSVDFVTHIGSLEHYEGMIAGASEIARVLKPSGRACILLPNAFGLMGNIRYVRRTGEIFDDGQPLQRYATRKTWEAILQRGGLTIERIVPWGEVNWPATQADFWWMLLRPQKWLRGLLAAATPLNLANHFVFLCRSAAADSAPAVEPSALYPPLIQR